VDKVERVESAYRYAAARAGATYLHNRQLLLAFPATRGRRRQNSVRYSQNEDSSQNKHNSFRDSLLGVCTHVCVCVCVCLFEFSASDGELIQALRHSAAVNGEFPLRKTSPKSRLWR